MQSSINKDKNKYHCLSIHYNKSSLGLSQLVTLSLNFIVLFLIWFVVSWFSFC